MHDRFIVVLRGHSTPFDKRYGYQEASRWQNKQFIIASLAFERNQTSSTRNGKFAARRVIKSFIFSNTELDYCGLFYIKDSSNQEKKVYVAIFICFATKVVHIEIVNSLTKDDCLDAAERFCGRSGLLNAFDL